MLYRQFMTMSLFVITLVTLFYCQLRASDDKSPLTAASVAFVDIENVISQSQVAKSANKLLEKEMNSFQSNFQQQETKLRDQENALTAEIEKLSPEAGEKKKQDFRNKVMEFQRQVQTKRLSLGELQAKISKKINETCVNIIEDVSKERGYLMVIPTSQTLYVNPGRNISEEILEKLNKTLSKIDVKALEK